MRLVYQKYHFGSGIRIGNGAIVIFCCFLTCLKTKKPVNTELYELLIFVETPFVGAARFELATSTSQMWRDNRATLRPEFNTLQGQGLRRGWDSNPRYSLTRTTI